MTDPSQNQNESRSNELVDLTQQLLESIAQGNWETYTALCDPTISAFEPESRGVLVEGMDFHRFYFGLGSSEGPYNTTMCSPHVRLLGDVGIVCYVRLVQRLDGDGRPVTHRVEETRVWHRGEQGWRHVHFHRSVTN